MAHIDHVNVAHAQEGDKCVDTLRACYLPVIRNALSKISICEVD